MKSKWAKVEQECEFWGKMVFLNSANFEFGSKKYTAKIFKPLNL